MQYASFAIRFYLAGSGRNREAARLISCPTSNGVDHYMSSSVAVLRVATKPPRVGGLFSLKINLITSICVNVDLIIGYYLMLFFITISIVLKKYSHIQHNYKFQIQTVSSSSSC